MFAPEIKVEKFAVIDVITTSVDEPVVNPCPFQTDCLDD